VNGVTIVSASSMDKDFEGFGGNKEAARKVGQIVGKRAIEKRHRNQWYSTAAATCIMAV